MIVVDSSALIAILDQESDTGRYAKIMQVVPADRICPYCAEAMKLLSEGISLACWASYQAEELLKY